MVLIRIQEGIILDEVSNIRNWLDVAVDDVERRMLESHRVESNCWDYSTTVIVGLVDNDDDFA